MIDEKEWPAPSPSGEAGTWPGSLRIDPADAYTIWDWDGM